MSYAKAQALNGRAVWKGGKVFEDKNAGCGGRAMLVSKGTDTSRQVRDV